MALEISKSIINIIKTKNFYSYKNANINFNISLQNNDDFESHHFSKFDTTSFKVACKVKEQYSLIMLDDLHIYLSKEDAENQLVILAAAIKDADVFIKELEKHFE